jgi:hypothetical protein
VDGPALTAAGGLARALDRMTAAAATGAASQARQAFATGPGPSSAAPSPTAPSPAAAVSTADPRAVSYGFGIPLRPRLGVTGPTTAGLVRELHRNVASGGDQPPQTSDPTVPGWLALSAADPAAGPPPAVGCGCGAGP